MRFFLVSEEAKNRIPIKHEEDSHLVAVAIELSDFDLIRDISKIVGFLSKSAQNKFS